MSQEQAKKFIERLKTDKEFKTKIMAVEDVAERLKLANAEGYDFSEQEVKSMAAELSDAEVNSVVGAGGVAGGVLSWGYSSPCPRQSSQAKCC